MPVALIHASTRRNSSPSPSADFGRALAKMKCPSNYLSGLTKYVLTSSILPIPVSINGYVLYGWCMKHVPALFISVLHTVWCSSINCPVQFHQYQQQTYNTWLEISLEMLPIWYFWWMLTLLYLTCLSMYLRRVITADDVVCRQG